MIYHTCEPTKFRKEGSLSAKGTSLAVLCILVLGCASVHPPVARVGSPCSTDPARAVVTLTVHYDAAAGKASMATLEKYGAYLCVSGYPDTVAWELRGDPGELSIAWEPGATPTCSSTKNKGSKLLLNGGAGKVTGKRQNSPKRGQCWQYTATVTDTPTGTSYTVDPEIIWKK